MTYENDPGDPGGYGPPEGYDGVPMPPNNQLVPAILSTLFCCPPLGLVSIVFASRVNSRLVMGDLQGAIRASEAAKKWWTMALVMGLVGMVLYVLIFVVADTFSISTSSY